MICKPCVIKTSRKSGNLKIEVEQYVGHKGVITFSLFFTIEFNIPTTTISSSSGPIYVFSVLVLSNCKWLAKKVKKCFKVLR